MHGVSEIVRRGHIDLVETLAEDIADFCLGLDCVEEVTVRASKPDAIASAKDAGVQITRARR